MRLQDDIDFTTLTWVKGELDETLKQARHALEAFVEDPTDVSQMRFCATYLHQVQGTLRMVELYGAAMVTEEMERVASALIGDAIGNRDEAYTVLMRGIVQLPDYLERLQSGHKDIPIVLLPLLNDLRAARGEKGLSESVLFTPDLSRPLPGSARGPEKAFAPEQLSRVAELLRQQFQISLLKWFKNEDPATHVAKLAQTCDKLVTLLAQEDARRLFWVSAGLLTALRERAFDPPAPLKQALGKVEREIKRLADQGEAGFRVEPPRELTRTLLYFAAHAPTQHGRIAELRQTFDLEKLLPSEEELRHAQGSISGHNRALLDTVSAAIKEDLLRVKDALDLYMRTQSGDVGGLAAQAEVLGRVADTLGMLGLGVPRGVVVEQRQAVEDVAAGRRAADESSLLDIAGALLYVESSLDDQVQHLGSGGGIRDASKADARKVLDALVKEAQANFAQAKQCFVAFVESNWDHTQLQDVPRLLDEVSGALRILELDEPPRYLSAIGRFTEAELLGRHRVPNGQQLDTLADALASLEYYLEALREHRAGRERILDVARQRLEALGYWPIPQAGAASVLDDVPIAASPLDEVVAAASPAPVEAEPAEAAPAVEGDAGSATASAPAEPPIMPVTTLLETATAPSMADDVPAQPATAAAPAEPVAAAVDDAHLGFELAGEDIDEEIREVFIEEVQEEINNLGELLPAWKSNPESPDLLKPIRRVFHTLKGSGRLVGALTLGEFSWKIENMLNRVLDQSIRPDAGVVEIIAVSHDVLPELLSALKGEQRIRSNLEGIKHAAERIAGGELLSAGQVRAAAQFERAEPVAAPLPGAPEAAADAAIAEDAIAPAEVTVDAVVDASPDAVTAAGDSEALAVGMDAELEAELAALAAETDAVTAAEDIDFSVLAETEAASSGDAMAELEAELAAAELAFVPTTEQADDGLDAGVEAADAGDHGMADTLPVADAPVPEPTAATAPEAAGHEVTSEALRATGTPFSIDSVLFDILKAEVAGHLETVDDFVARSRVSAEPVNDPLLRAVHTMSGAFAMTEVPHITDVVGPLEGYIKRLIAQRATPSAHGVALMAEAADAIRALMQALEAAPSFAPQFPSLSERLMSLRDTLAEPTGPLLPMHVELDHADGEADVHAAEPIVPAEAPGAEMAPQADADDLAASEAAAPAGFDQAAAGPVLADELVLAELSSLADPEPTVAVEFSGIPETDLGSFDSRELEDALRALPSVDESGEARVLDAEAEVLDLPVDEVSDIAEAVPVAMPESDEIVIEDAVLSLAGQGEATLASTPPDAAVADVAAEETGDLPALADDDAATHAESAELAALEGEAFEELSLDDAGDDAVGDVFDIVENDFADTVVEPEPAPASAESEHSAVAAADADAESLVALLLAEAPAYADAPAEAQLAGEMDEAAIEAAIAGVAPEAVQETDARVGSDEARDVTDMVEAEAVDAIDAEIEEASAASVELAAPLTAPTLELPSADADAVGEADQREARDSYLPEMEVSDVEPIDADVIEALDDVETLEPVEAVDVLAPSANDDASAAVSADSAMADGEAAGDSAVHAAEDDVVPVAVEAGDDAPRAGVDVNVEDGIGAGVTSAASVVEAIDEDAEAEAAYAAAAAAEAAADAAAEAEQAALREAEEAAARQAAIEAEQRAAAEAEKARQDAAAEAAEAARRAEEEASADSAAAAFVARTAAAASGGGLAGMLAGADPDPDAPLQLADMDEELLDIFLEEGVDILDHSDSLLAKLRDNPADRELVVGLQRDLHTLKGGARMAGIVPIGDLGHAAESLLEAVADGRRDLGGTGMEVLERVFDRLHGMVTRVGERRALAMPTMLLGFVDALVRGETLDFGAAAEAEPAPADDIGGAGADAEPAAPVGAPAEPARPAAPAARPTALDTALDDDDASVRAPQEQIRIRADLLDRLVNYAGEVAIYRARLEQQVGSFRGGLVEMEATTSRLREQLRRLEIETEAQIIARYQREQDEGEAQNFDPLELDRFSNLQQLSRALSESAADLTNLQGTLEDLTRQYETLLLQQSRVSSELQEGLMRTRMVPFDALVPRLRRILRQTASELGKKAQLKVEGAQGEMDRNVLDRMTAPLEHMLRNALAHGLEMPADREKVGKPGEGTVRIQVSREASEVVIRVSDDGRGMDREAIRRKAIERGLMDADAQLSDRDLYGFVLESGFSTAQTVSKIAGRGVGMDVVHSEIKQLGGSLYIESEFGKGTEFIIRLPFTLAVTQAVFVKLGETHYAIPITSVQGVARIAPAELQKQQEAGNPHFDYAGERYAVYDLGLLLGHAAVRASESLQVPLMLARSGDLRAAICVDQVIGSREIVVKPTGPQINSIPGIFGATVMGDGSVVVILDVAPLVRRAAALHAIGETPAAAAPIEVRQIPLVMVVDDSITMRKVSGRVLERAGYEVMTAKDGVDAIEKMQERVPDAMLLDIEMPRMDGYELATHMRNDTRLRNVPIIMITSRTGEKHRQRAFEIGVDRYLGKPYQEPELLRNVQDVLKVGHGRAG